MLVVLGIFIVLGIFVDTSVCFCEMVVVIVGSVSGKLFSTVNFLSRVELEGVDSFSFIILS